MNILTEQENSKIVETGARFLKSQMVMGAFGQVDESKYSERMLKGFSLGYIFGFGIGVGNFFGVGDSKEKVGSVRKTFDKLFGNVGGALFKTSLALKGRDTSFKIGEQLGMWESKMVLNTRTLPTGLAKFLLGSSEEKIVAG